MIATWVQYVEDGVEVRAVVTGQCPSILLDNVSVQMSERAAPTEQHPNRVCFTSVTVGVKQIILKDKALPVPIKTTPKRVLVIGDTGCRVSKKHGLYQACNNNTVWPFERVAEAAAASEPDIILYTGDYIYRESPCPAGNMGCANTPFGDTQATWDADWFQPSQSIRAAAPFVFTRGNHESCSRAGLGWFRYLDARAFENKCLDKTQPWQLQVGKLGMVVMDTAILKDANKKSLVNYYATQLSKVDRMLAHNG